MDELLYNQLKRNLEPRLEANRMAVLLAMSMVGSLALGFAIASMMPLKERVPYFVSTDRDSGQVAVSTTVAQKFTPDARNIKYFAAKFVRELLTIDPYRTRNEFLPDVKTQVLGKAKAEVGEFLVSDDTLERMARDPSLERNVELQRITILPSAQNVLTIIVRLSTLSNSGVTKTETKAVTLHYALEPVHSEAEALRNPMGFYVTQFAIDEELGQ